LGHEQIPQGDHDDGDRHIGDEDANPWQVVTDLAVFAKLTVLQFSDLPPM
jgi:hypothetical protein